MEDAWAIQPDARGVRIAVLDTGLNPVEGLEQARVLAGVDFVNLDDDPADDNGHGTQMVSVIVAAAVAIEIIPVKVLDELLVGTEATVAAGLRFAVALGADVISMSLAFPEGFVPSADLAAAIEEAHAAGVLMVAASGNHGTEEVAYPAAFGSVAAVGAVRRVGRGKLLRDAYSGYGSPMELVAPGGTFGRDGGDSDAIWAFDHEGAWTKVAGTSAATAQVAGVAALLLASGADAEEAREALRRGAGDIEPGGFDPRTGFGVVDAAESLSLALAGSREVARPPTLFVNPVLALLEDGSNHRRVVAVVEVIDEANEPVAGVWVQGHFRLDARHSVRGRTDAAGRVVVFSEPALAGQIFEFGVDWVFGDDFGAIPRGFARFEAATFRTLGSFVVGAGLEPSPFVVGIDGDYIGPTLAGALVDTDAGLSQMLPDGFDGWRYIPGLLARSYADAAVLAPTVLILDAALLESDCELARSFVAVDSYGAGLLPSPFILDDRQLPGGPTQSQVILRSDFGQSSVYIDYEPTSLLELDFTVGEPALVEIDYGVCGPTTHLVANVDAIQEAIGGSMSLRIVASAQDPAFEAFLPAWRAITAAAGRDGVLAPRYSRLYSASGLAPFAGGMATVP